MERTRCPKCDAPAPPEAIGCGKCRIVFSEYERQQAEALRQIDDATADRIARLALRKIWRPLLAVMGTVFGLGLWQTCRHIDRAIEKQFAEPRVSETLHRVASEKAADIIASRVEPAVKQFEADLEATKASVTQAATATRAELEKQLQDVTTEAKAARSEAGQALAENEQTKGEIQAIRDQLRGLANGKRDNVEGVKLPGGITRAELDKRYPLGWAFFFERGGRLVADEKSFKTVEVREWPNMRTVPGGAMFSGGKIEHKGTGGGTQEVSVFVPGKSRWSPFQIQETCVWYEVLAEGEAGSLGVVGFAPASEPMLGITLFSPGCRH